MKATIMYGPGDVRVENVPDSKIIKPTDAIIRHSVLECVGTDLSMQTSMYIARPGGTIGRVGVPHDVNIPAANPTFFKNLIIAGSPALSRAYFDKLVPDVLNGRIQPGRAFDLAEASAAAPFEYVALLFSVLWGFAIWGEIPTLATWIGAFLTVSSGLYILYRERAERPLAAPEALETN